MARPARWDFLRQLLARAGRKAASLGTLGLIAPGLPPTETLTTPDPVSLAATLARLKGLGIEDVAMEASSHGIAQSRLDGLRFMVAGFSNLTRDHLDYHGGMAQYRAAKLGLFERLVMRGGAIRAMADLDAETLAALRRIAAMQRVDFAETGVARSVPVPDGQELEVAGTACG